MLNICTDGVRNAIGICNETLKSISRFQKVLPSIIYAFRNCGFGMAVDVMRMMAVKELSEHIGAKKVIMRFESPM